MSTTVLEALEGAKVNFENLGSMAVMIKRHPIYLIAMEQLTNGIKALEDGHGPNFVLQESMFGEIKK